jgi:CMP-N-acetylneuraminic acid synthetase
MQSKNRGEVLALIPARSGSKSIRDKNIRIIGGKPLLAWSVEYALQSAAVTRTVVSTDSELYAQIAVEHGAEAPFLRPPEFSEDHSLDLDVFRHALNWLEVHDGYAPEICAHLRPTYPLRRPGVLDEMVKLLRLRPDLDCVRTVTEVVHPPFKMWHRDETGMMQPVIPVAPGVDEPWSAPRQVLPTAYIQTANIDVIRTSVITERNSMTGDRVFGYVEPDFHDIDTADEFDHVAALMQNGCEERPGLAPDDGTKTFCFDIDGVIATLTPGNDYAQAGPRLAIIELLRRLYDAGHRIILFTARGTMTGMDWRRLTVLQLQQWDVPFHELRFGKPAADFYIDDRMLSFDELDRTARRLTEVCT